MPKSTDHLDDPHYIDALRLRYTLDWPCGVYDCYKEKWLSPNDHEQGYSRFTIVGRLTMFHRLVYALCKGPVVGNVDHIDGDVTNNHPDNLRLCCQSLNTANSKVRSDNTSGYTGVIWHKASNKWQAQTMLKGKRIHIGLFSCPKEAALAYNHELTKLFGHQCTYNKVFEDYPEAK